ncbi:YggT family protein [candidate division KSB1 bacterium]|nr:YggT family protein [candidate division KSB1 bacterium]
MFIIANFILMLARLIDIGISLYIIALIGRVVLSWINYNPNNQIFRFLVQITEPVLKKIRRYLPPMGGLDLSPMVLMLILYIIEGFIVSTLREFALFIR